MKMRILCVLAVLCSTLFAALGQQKVQLALLKYRGGGDWYANPTSLPNLATYCNEHLKMNLEVNHATVDVGSPEIFDYPILHMTGHGNVVFSQDEADNLRLYLESGGFLHIDDNYGMDPYVRAALTKVFPDQSLVVLPVDHPIFNQHYTFSSGLPKIHKHDELPAQALGLFHKGRLVCLYTYESDLGDGWEDANVHNDPEEVRRQALQMGANIIQYAVGARGLPD